MESFLEKYPQHRPSLAGVGIVGIHETGSSNIAGWLENGGPGLSRCMDPIEHRDIPASYVNLPEGSWDSVFFLVV